MRLQRRCRKDRVENQADIVQVFSEKFFEPARRHSHSHGNFFTVALRIRKGVCLCVLEHLQPVLENSEKNIRFPKPGRFGRRKQRAE